MEKAGANFFITICSFICCVHCQNPVSAQCTTPINNFPYYQNFEAENGNWTINGSQSSWAWGTPIKPIINTAASGINCWVTGGLTNGFYNNAEASWIQSPCFDFTNIAFPYLSVKIWWETERSYDGATLQSSTDNGNTWNTLGTASGGNSCLDSNWFNVPSIRYLGSFGSSADGWSGSKNAGAGNCSSSNGSGGWVTAKHSLSELGGKPNVIFRFAFGAGTQCNNFDGFAMDDFSITAAVPITGNIAYSCIDSNAASFKFNTASCPTIFNWDFNDPVSGANNSATSANPTHIFSAPGTYTVTIMVGNAGSPAFTTNQTITILSASATETTPIDCNGGATGAATVLVYGSPEPFSYSWNTQPEQYTVTAFGLPAGTYSVNVSALNACDIVATVTLTNIPMLLSSTIQRPGCMFDKGSIILAVTGGTPPYNYTWLPAVSIADSAVQLAEGNYIAIVTDSRLCSLKDTFTIAKFPAPSVTAIKINDVDCNGILLGKAFAIATGGTAPYTYSWNATPVQNTDTATGLREGISTVTITDVNGCTATSAINIGIGGICNDVYYPNTFTPNQDGRNDLFGPTGNLLTISNYKMIIYNRYGQQVFYSNNPLLKWDGTFKEKKLDTGTYIWQATYKYLSRFQKSPYGTVTIVR
jgi:gliding motility-associated-like protein